MKNIVLASIFAGLVVGGCAHTSGKDFDEASVKKITTGKTTSSDVVSMFGTPFTKNRMPDGSQKWQYQFLMTKAKLTPLSFVVGSLGTDYERNQKIVMLAFDKQGVVTDCTYMTFTNENSDQRFASGLYGEGDINQMKCQDAP